MSAKVHNHSEQFDGALHPACGRSSTGAVPSDVFEATDPSKRCAHCARDWFPNRQPDWHLKAAKQRLQETA